MQIRPSGPSAAFEDALADVLPHVDPVVRDQLVAEREGVAGFEDPAAQVRWLGLRVRAVAPENRTALEAMTRELRQHAGSASEAAVMDYALSLSERVPEPLASRALVLGLDAAHRIFGEGEPVPEREAVANAAGLIDWLGVDRMEPVQLQETLHIEAARTLAERLPGDEGA
ncbi:MAG: hypothetical protein AB1758_13740, partial [Candidatus Eremiobacterota bacterium]